MKTLLTYGVIRGGKIIAQYDGTGALIAQEVPSPRKESFMVPVIKRGKIIGYQNLFGSDMTIYSSIEGGD